MDMKLYLLDTPELLQLVAGWLAQKENHQWLDFGNGRQIVTPALLKIMVQRETYFLRAFTSDRHDIPIGIVGLNSVDRTFKTAMFWGAVGEKSFRNRGRPCDRLMFDLLASEHRELEDDRRHWTEGSHREANREQRQAQPG
jgi:hypothetical protein